MAGLSGDSGKSLVALGLAAAWTDQGKKVAPFKKGPDYIDSAWLTLAANHPCRNLDTYLMSKDVILNTWIREGLKADIAVIEGNRGLFDGLDARGSHSTAGLAKIIKVPILLVIDVTKMTRTAAALVLGVKAMDPDISLIGVVLNRVAGKRHEKIIRDAIEKDVGVPVLGAIRKLDNKRMIPGRHLGLITTDEHPESLEAIETARNAVNEYLDIKLIEKLISENTAGFNDLDSNDLSSSERQVTKDIYQNGLKKQRVRIGIIRDAAFPFYYPENLESLESEGGELIEISALTDNSLPENLDAIYIGGGFPETHAGKLSANEAFLNSLKEAASKKIPIYAECGGLMLLAREIEYKGQWFPMAGVLPIDVSWSNKPVGHGYVSGKVDKPNLFFPIGTELKGHEFHYSKVHLPGMKIDGVTSISLSRGYGAGDNRDGISIDSTFAGYTHIHASGQPEWAEGIIKAAREYRNRLKINN
ncbi:MAG: cobyrinate a,c-diamide synthase [Candidatus Electryonea clarkiae]|nr:cobyrinate a,c-diamide synthase [Candidatus Electryonea clarkiae]MDP8288354.1 cobyrinate a,c-diamide synthase [Candidatus Electryonea clarkiae]